jgi:hypothetical protein
MEHSPYPTTKVVTVQHGLQDAAGKAPNGPDAITQGKDLQDNEARIL